MGRKERRRETAARRRREGTASVDLEGLLQTAVAHHRAGRGRDAEALYRRILSVRPDHPEALHLLGVMALQAGVPEDAFALIRKALRRAPDRPDMHNNLGNALSALERWAEAETAFARAVALAPDFAEAHYNHGGALRQLGRLDDSIAAYRRALELNPADAQTHNNLGVALKAAGRLPEAAEAYRRAVELKPDHVDALLNLADTLHQMGRSDDSIAVLERVLELSPDHEQALGRLVRPYQSACEWEKLAALLPRLDAANDRAMAEGRPAPESPFIHISRCMDPERNLAVARSWTAAMADLAGPPPARPRRAADAPLSVGYLSSDLRNHAIAHLARRVFELHARPEFRIVAYSSGPDDGSRYRREIEGFCDSFVDVQDLSDAGTARRIAEDGIDILVDLNGHTDGSRLAVLAWHPAPVRATWLGHPGTTGADFVDYAVVDANVVPPEHEPFFSEAPVILPHAYQATDDQPVFADSPATRIEAGLPEDGLVLCSFNLPYKFEPQVFAAWMEILGTVEDAILWLPGASARAEANLRGVAAAAGVTPERLVFAPHLPKDQHLARFRFADLVLDTLTYGGHTTTCDALVAGVPVVTVLGGHFASRVCAGALRSLGLDEVVTDSLDAYRDLALALATDRARLAGLRAKIEENRGTRPYFDSAGFVRGLESAYREMWRRHTAGEAPRRLVVDPD